MLFSLTGRMLFFSQAAVVSDTTSVKLTRSYKVQTECTQQSYTKYDVQR